MLVLVLVISVGAARPFSPDDVVARAIVDGDVVVHVVVHRTPHVAAEYPGVEDVQQRRRLRRRALAPSEEHPRRDGPSIQFRIRVLPLDDGRALQRHAREQPLGLGVAEDAGHALERGGPGSLGVPPDGPGGDGHVASEGERAGLGEGLDGVGIVEDEDEVGQLEADLAAEAGTGGGDGAGRAPAAVGEAGDDQAAAETGGAEEAGLEDGEDGEALCAGEDRGRDDLVRTESLAWVDEAGKDLPALLAFRCRSG